jgi:hypothetical protein
VRKIWKNGNVFPYLGGGIALIAASQELDNGFVKVDADDGTLGLWAAPAVLSSREQLQHRHRPGYSAAKVDLDFGGGNIVHDVNAAASTSAC